LDIQCAVKNSNCCTRVNKDHSVIKEPKLVSAEFG